MSEPALKRALAQIVTYARKAKQNAARAYKDTYGEDYKFDEAAPPQAGTLPNAADGGADPMGLR